MPSIPFYKNREIIFKRHDMPSPWMNYLTNGEMFTMISQAGGNLSWYKSPQIWRIGKYNFYNLPVNMICTPKVRQTFGVHIMTAWFRGILPNITILLNLKFFKQERAKEAYCQDYGEISNGIQYQIHVQNVHF